MDRAMIQWLKRTWSILTETVEEWSFDDGARHSAALAYYALFSIAPLLIVATAVVTLFFGEEAAHSELRAQLSLLVSPGVAETLEELVQDAWETPGGGLLPTIIGVVAMLWGATRGFAQLQDSLNTIWAVRADPERWLSIMIRKRLLSFLMVLGAGGLMLASLLASAVVQWVAAFATELLPWDLSLVTWLDAGIGWLLVTGLLMIVYKVLPDVEIRWRDVWVGAVVTGLLLVAGRYAVAWYLGTFSVTSTYGAAGSLVALLIFVYYSAQLLLLGAEFTEVYARRFGRPIRPSRHAVPLIREVGDDPRSKARRDRRREEGES